MLNGKISKIDDPIFHIPTIYLNSFRKPFCEILFIFAFSLTSVILFLIIKPELLFLKYNENQNTLNTTHLEQNRTHFQKSRSEQN
jgi:hypothetical protein